MTRKFLKPRFLVMLLCGAYVCLFAGFEYQYLVPALLLIAAGIAIRLWANGYIEKGTRLTTSGPYAYVRHPLYLGTMLIFWGFMTLCGSIAAGIVMFIPLSLAYARTIRDEEEFLERQFGPSFLIYRASVPAVLPKFSPYLRGEKWSFRLTRILFNHKEHKVLIWVFIIVAGLYLKDQLLARGAGLDFKLVTVMTAVLALAVFDSAFCLRKKTA